MSLIMTISRGAPQKFEIQRFEIRKKYVLPENYFLASARFVEKKNLPKLIQAYAEYRQQSFVFAKTTADKEISEQNVPWDLVLS